MCIRHRPFDDWPVWRDVRKLSLKEQKSALRDPEMKRRLIEAAQSGPSNKTVTGGEARPPEWDYFYLMDKATWPHRTLKDIAAERGTSPVEAMIDIALENDLQVFFRQPISNEDEDAALAVMKHPRSCVTFSDSGAHVSQIMDSSLQTHLLSYWVRERQEFTGRRREVARFDNSLGVLIVEHVHYVAPRFRPSPFR